MKTRKGKNFSCNNSSGKRIKGDAYQTPYCLTDLFLDAIKNDLVGKTVWDPACGDGAIIKVLRKKMIHCIGTDVRHSMDFLDTVVKKDVFKTNLMIITNPPYSKAFEFIKQAKIVSDHFAFLLPLSYLHGKQRYDKIYSDKKFPLHDVYIFTRYPLLEETVRPDGKHKTGMMVYAWFVWKKKKRKTGAEIHHLDNDPFVVRS